MKTKMEDNMKSSKHQNMKKGMGNKVSEKGKKEINMMMDWMEEQRLGKNKK